MFRSAIIGGLAFSLPAFAGGFIPLQLTELDAQARTVVVKKYMELTGASGDQIYYRNLSSDVGKYSSQWGDFNFSAEIWISNQRKFSCVTHYVRAETKSGVVTINNDDLNSNSKCTEVTPTE